MALHRRRGHHVRLRGRGLRRVPGDAARDEPAAASIAADSHGGVHVLFLANGDLSYASDASGQWVVEPVDDFGRTTSVVMAIDSTDVIRAAYPSFQDISYVTNEGGPWQFDTALRHRPPAPGPVYPQSFYGPAIAAGPGGLVAIATASGALAWRSTRDWAREWIPAWCGMQSIAIDELGQIHVACRAADGVSIATLADVRRVDQDCDGADGVDADGDGHASEASGGDDCDDDDRSVHPGAEDRLWDGVDSDCDGRG